MLSLRARTRRHRRSGSTCSSFASARRSPPRCPARPRRSQADRDRDGLVGLEQQRRESAVVAEPVAAGRAADGLDGVAELAQPLDVLAHGALADAEERGQLGPGRRSPAPAGGRAGRTAGTTSGATWRPTAGIGRGRVTNQGRSVPDCFYRTAMTTHQNPSQTLSFRPFTVSDPAGRDRRPARPPRPHPLRRRAGSTPASDDWSAGTPVSYLREMVEHWAAASTGAPRRSG